MISHRISVYVIIVLCFATIYGLFTVKDSVVTLRAELQEVKKQVQNEEDAIRILKAELAYLGSPERIQRLAHKYLTLEKPTVAQMIKDPLSEHNPSHSKVLASNKVVKKTNQWRYKRGSGKYLTMAKSQK